MIIKAFRGKQPKIHPEAWIAENAVIIGDVEISPRSGIWYNVVLRGDLNRIRIGAETNIQDGAVVHVESEDGPCLIGNRVTVGHQTIIHGCRIADDALIGMGATVLSLSRIGSGALIAANALIREDETVPARTLWAGLPASRRSTVDDQLFDRMQQGCRHYVELAETYRRDDDSLSDH